MGRNKSLKPPLIKAGIILGILGAVFAYVLCGCSSYQKFNEKSNDQEKPLAIKKAEKAKSKSDIRAKNDIEEEATFSEEQLKKYYAAYEDPYVLHLRKALNGYLNGSNEGMGIPPEDVGLSAFDKSYFESKFIVFFIENAIMGGKTITIIFQDKPDKAFTAWVYKMAGDEYDLRSFWEADISQEELARIRKIYKKFLEDKEHAL